MQVSGLMQTYGESCPLWGLVAYFNPLHWHCRKRNYEIFCSLIGIPLITVELATDGRFELDGKLSAILVRLGEGDIMWQRERLVNIGFHYLPVHCEAVAILDCDSIFANANWATATLDALSRYQIVQPFSQIVYLSQNDPMPRPSSDSQALLQSEPMGPQTRNGRVRTLGGVWVARKNILDKCGLYDACILGGADEAILAAAKGEFQRCTRVLRMCSAQARHYLRWAEQFYNEVRGELGCLRSTLYHLWHGHKISRRYRERHSILSNYSFDPDADIVITASGPWKWNSKKHRLHEQVTNYFRSRKEDG